MSNMNDSKRKLREYDLKHGKWNPDTHCYEKRDNGKGTPKATARH